MPDMEKLFGDLQGLTAKQRTIAQYILKAPEEAAYLSLKELSDRVGVSEVSVLRMCRALGFDSFVALKKALQQHIGRQVREAAPPPFLQADAPRRLGTPEETLAAVCQDDVHNVSRMYQELDIQKLFACARGLLDADEVVIFAHDASFILAEYLSYRLNFLQIKARSIKLGDSDLVQSVLARLGAKDYVISLSFPPYYAPLYNVSSFCRHRKVPTMAITDSHESPAVTENTNVFLCRTNARYFYNSQTSTIAFMNLLTACIALEMGPKFDQILADEQDVSRFITATDSLKG